MRLTYAIAVCCAFFAAVHLTAHLTATAARAGSAEILISECHKQLNLGAEGCACVGGRAEEVLDANQQALVIAMVTQDQAAGDALRAQMSAQEVADAATFMVETPQICASQ